MPPRVNLLDGVSTETKQDDIIAALATLLSEAQFTAVDFATEATQAAANVLLTAIDGDTSNLDVALSTRLSEATFTAADLSSETTLEAVRVLLASIESDTNAIASVDFATQTTLASVLSVLNDIEINTSGGGLTDAELRATPVPVTGTVTTTGGQTDALTDTQLRASDVEVNDDAAQALLTSIDAKDFATETTVATLLTEAAFVAEDFATEASLAAAVALLTTIDADTSSIAAEDFATEATVASLLTEATFSAKDFATETTLEAARVLLVTLAGIDFATEASLATLLTDAELRAAPVNVDTGLSTQTDALTDAELRDSAVNVATEDPWPMYDAPVTPTAGSVSSVVADQTIVAPPSGQSLRLRRFHLHMDPEVMAGTYNTVTLSLGSQTVFTDKFEPGLPYAEGVVVDGGIDDALTITTTGSSEIFYNLRTEIF